jgi:hypothetical protein
VVDGVKWKQLFRSGFQNDTTFSAKQLRVPKFYMIAANHLRPKKQTNQWARRDILMGGAG